jgi:hypothetical protein
MRTETNVKACKFERNMVLLGVGMIFVEKHGITRCGLELHCMLVCVYARLQYSQVHKIYLLPRIVCQSKAPLVFL